MSPYEVGFISKKTKKPKKQGPKCHFLIISNTGQINVIFDVDLTDILKVVVCYHGDFLTDDVENKVFAFIVSFCCL